MLKPEIEEALNRQLNQEQTASHEYLAMAAYFEEESFAGFARYMLKQSEEERAHAVKFFTFIISRGGRARLGAIAEPRIDFESPRVVFETAYAREQSNTRCIHELYALAEKHADYATKTLLHWFIEEQVEEEEWCEEAIALLTRAGDNPTALLMLDQRYGGMSEQEADGEK